MESVTNMKKILYLLPLLLLFVPIRSYAVSSATLETVIHGLSGLESNGFSAYGVAPLLPLLEDDPYESYNSVLTSQTGVSSLGLSMSDISEVTYDETLKNDFADYTFHDKDGNTLQWSDIKLYEFENAFYHGYFFTDSNGDIIYDSADNTLINYNYGGSTYSADDIDGIYNNIIDTLNESNMIYNPSGIDVGNKSFYIFVGSYQWDTYLGAQYLYIPNIYQYGVCVCSPQNSGDGSVREFYSNDPSLFDYHIVYEHESGTLQNVGMKYFSIESGTWNVYGDTYHYKAKFDYTQWSNESSNGNYSDWINGVYDNPRAHSLFGVSEGNFSNTSKFIQSRDLTTFIGVSVSDTLSLTDTYSYDDVFDYADAIADSVGVPVDTFVPSDAISTENLPVVYSISIDVPVSVIPFPDVKDDTDDPAIPVNPSLDYPFDTTINPDSVNIPDIPIISNLKDRFPFSIPWDIKNMLVNLRTTPQAPVFDLSFTIPVINYEWETVVDLSSWNSSAELFRLLFLISFIIGLALFSYRHFFGS